MRWSILLLLAACADLPTVGAGVCGNGVLDDTEDCDGFEDDTLGAKVSCGAAQRACRYVCEGDALCPTGWACGADAICRPHGGTFQAGAAIDLPGEHLELADFDGDGRLDLFGDDLMRFAVAYGSGGSFAAPKRVIGRRGARPPVFADMDDDGRQDVVLDDFGGLFLWMGSRSRELTPTIHASQQLSVDGTYAILPLRRLPETPLPDFMHILGLENETRVSIEGTTGGGSVVLPGGPPIGEPLLVELVPDLVDAELVLAVGSRVYVLGTEHVVVSPKEEYLVFGVQATVDVDATIVTGVAVADIDGDGHDDLLTAIPGRYGQQIAVAYGDGGLGFHDEFGQLGHAMVETDLEKLYPVVRPFVGDPRRLPLASLRLGADPREALVSEAGVFSWVLFDVPERTDDLGEVHLSDAVVADFNLDGHDDVVVSHIGGRGVHLLLSDAEGKLGTLFFDTDGVPSRLRVAKFNGDLIPDLAFLERSLVPGERDRLAVMYSEAPGKLAPAVSLGEVDEVVSLALGELSYGTGMDLLLLSRRAGAAAGQLELATIADDGERRLGSQLHLFGDSFLADFEPTLGDVAGDAARDLVLSYSTSLFILRGEGGGRFGSDDPINFELYPYLPEDAFQACPRVAVSDFTPAGHDEILVFANARPCDPDEPWVHAPTPYLAVVEEGTRAQAYELPAGLFEPLAVVAADLDGDGDLEQLVHFASYEHADAAAESDVLFVLDFDPRLGLVATQLPVGAPFTAFAALDLDREPGVELVVSLADEVVLLDRDEHGAWYRAGTLALPPARALHAGDLDGDGLTDLVAVESGGFPVAYLAQPQILPGVAGR